MFCRTVSALALALCFTACGHAGPEASTLQGRDDVPAENSQFPIGPNARLTPGTTCSRPDTYRYPEHIAYCERDVSSGTKREIFVKYDRDLGYSTQRMNRGDFKIDHYIPLCMGGSNEVSNLWPQHKSVYVLTDKIEADLCQLMAAGRMTQREAMQTIRGVKNDLSTARAVEDRLEDQIH